jgi:hypothetical protein
MYEITIDKPVEPVDSKGGVYGIPSKEFYGVMVNSTTIDIYKEKTEAYDQLNFIIDKAKNDLDPKYDVYRGAEISLVKLLPNPTSFTVFFIDEILL